MFTGPLAKLKQNIDAVKRRHGFDTIRENYDAELDKPNSEMSSDSRGSISSGSQDVIDADEEVSYCQFSTVDDHFPRLKCSNL